MKNILFGETLIFASNDRGFIIDQKGRIIKKLISYTYNSRTILPADIIFEKILRVQKEIENLSNVFNCLRIVEKDLEGEEKYFYISYFKQHISILDMALKNKKSKNHYYNIKRKIITCFLNVLEKEGFTDEKFVEVFNEESSIVYAYQDVLNRIKRKKVDFDG